MAFPSHSLKYGSTSRLDGRRRVVRTQSGKFRIGSSRPTLLRTFSIRTVHLTQAQSQEWIDHFKSLGGLTDTITFEGTSYTVRYLAPPTRVQAGADQFIVRAKLREAVV